MKSAEEYTVYFEGFFNNVREAFTKSVDSRQNDELSSGELAHKKAMWSLPCPVHVVRLIVNTEKYKQANGSIYHLIAYELSNLGQSEVTYYGEIDIDEIGRHGELLESFNLKLKNVEDLKGFKVQGYADVENWHYVSVVSYDILENPIEHAREFRSSFSFMFSGVILQKFERIIDFNAKYGLKSEPVLSVSELFQKDETFSGFVRYDRQGNMHEITLEDMQRDMCDLQLIPQVPEDVRHVFSGAKRLYVFGYFDYYLFTISQHYAFLALESALRNRYQELHGESDKFIGLDRVIKELVDKKIIPKGEAKLYGAGRFLRNSLSHLTKRKVFSPGPGILERVAYQINYLYNKQ